MLIYIYIYSIHTYIYIYIYTQYVCVYIYIYIITYRGPLQPDDLAPPGRRTSFVLFDTVCVCVSYVYVYMYVYIYIYIYIYAYTHVYIYIERERQRDVITHMLIVLHLCFRVLVCIVYSRSATRCCRRLSPAPSERKNPKP